MVIDIKKLSYMVTKQEIIEAALELFWETSYNNVGINTICKKANIQKGSFYHYFKSKDELALDVLDLIWEQKSAEMSEYFDDKSMTPINRLIFFGQKMTEQSWIMLEEHGNFLGCPFGNFALEMSTQNREVREKVDEVFKAKIKKVSELFEEAQEVGEIVKSVDAYELASLMNSCVQGASIISKIRNDPTFIGKSVFMLLSAYIADPKLLETKTFGEAKPG